MIVISLKTSRGSQKKSFESSLFLMSEIVCNLICNVRNSIEKERK